MRHSMGSEVYFDSEEFSMEKKDDDYKYKFTWFVKNFASLKSEHLYSDCNETKTTENEEADNDTDELSWVIPNFNSEYRYSKEFMLGGHRGIYWYLMLRTQANSLPLFLTASDFLSLPFGWRIHAKYRLTLVNQLSKKLSIVQESQCWFDVTTPRVIYPDMIPFTKLYDKDGGFLVNNEAEIVVEVEVLEVIGKLHVPEDATQPLKKRKLEDGTSSVNEVNGFQVLPSHEKFVSRVFKKYPEIALQLGEKNQPLRTSCLYVFLGVIETLCKSIDELSSDNLVEADNSLNYLKCSGIKVDWLEKKLARVKEKKKEEQIFVARTQEVEETLNIFKQKCSEVEAMLEKENAKLVAVRAPPLTLDDAL